MSAIERNSLEYEVVAEWLAAEDPDDDSFGRFEPEAEVPEHLFRCPADTGGRFHLCIAQVVDGRTEPEPGDVELLREIVHARSLAVARHAVTNRRLWGNRRHGLAHWKSARRTDLRTDTA
jgi:hypothetical protein